MDNKFELFRNIDDEHRGKPFWSWNGSLDKEELLRQIHVMKEMGFGGFFMHSRTGLETEYLGEEWFEFINACADEAEKLGMEAWLYDEDRWPSGIAGGMVTIDPEFRMKSIKLLIQNVGEFQWSEDITAVFTCKLQGINCYDCKRIYKDTLSEMYSGNDILIFKVVEMTRHSFYNGFTYLDTLNRKATDRFIELTHEKYKKMCGDRLGKSIKGIFTDEPHRGTLMNAFGLGNDKDIWRAPWTDLLPDIFIKKFNYDLLDKLPELFLKLDSKSVSQVKWHYVELLIELFLDNFLKPINDWCIKNKLILTGHMLHEDSLTAQTAMNGSVMRCYEYMEYPGVDVLAEGNQNYWIAKQLSSVARQLGKKWMLTELYGCTGWQMDFESHKAVGDWQALYGINIRCHHLSWYTMEGEAKRDFPASILHQSTWWKEYKYVEDYFSRFGFVMSLGKPSCDVLVVNPIESAWCQIHPGWACMLGAKSNEVKEIEQKFMDLFNWLSGSHIDFDYGDEDILKRHCSIGRHNDGSPVLRVGYACYKVVVVSGMVTIRSSTLKILNDFMTKGGKVIVTGNHPAYVDALELSDTSRILEKADHVHFENDELVNAISPYLDNKIEILDCCNKNVEDIFCQIRIYEEKKHILLLNTNREKAYRKVKIKIRGTGFAEEWCFARGDRYLAAKSDKNGFIEITTDFEVCGEHMYVIAKEDNGIPARPVQEIKAVRTLKGPYEYKLDEPNICVLDMAQYKLDNEKWSEEKEILKVDREIRRKLGLEFRGGEMLQPWFAKKKEKRILSRLRLKYTFYVKYIPKGKVELVVERPEKYLIEINGIMLDTSAANGFWVDKCFTRLILPAECMREGENSVEFETEFYEGTNLEAVYILGQFGVQLEGSNKNLVFLPDRIYASDLTKQGFPFYTGKVKYKMVVDEKIGNKERCYIKIDGFEGACVKVISNGKEEGIIAWQPYEAEILGGKGDVELELVLTRRNTFGPLHLVPAIVAAYGPEHFVSEGENFSNDYMLIPSGILGNPQLIIKGERA